MPTLFKQPHSPYWYAYYTVDGKRYRISTKTSNKKEAEKTLVLIAEKINKGDISLQQKISNSAFIDRYLVYSQNHKANASYIRDKQVINIFFNMFLLSFKRIKPFQIEEYINNRVKQKKKHSTINREIGILKAMFNKAINWGYISQSPMKNVKNLPDTTKKLPRFLSVDEIKAVFAECSLWLYNIVATLILTGIRIGELINLTWNDINFNQQRIHIQSKDGWSPKTYQIRTIPMHPAFVNILKKLPKNTKYVFMSPEGCKLNSRNLQRRHFRKITKKLKLKDVTIHTLRHTFASHLIMKGVDILTVSKLLGHANTKTTEIYSHIAPDHFQAAINQFSSLALPFKK